MNQKEDHEHTHKGKHGKRLLVSPDNYLLLTIQDSKQGYINIIFPFSILLPNFLPSKRYWDADKLLNKIKQLLRFRIVPLI